MTNQLPRCPGHHPPSLPPDLSLWKKMGSRPRWLAVPHSLDWFKGKSTGNHGFYQQPTQSRLYPPVNSQFDPGSHRGWKTSETIKNG